MQATECGISIWVPMSDASFFLPIQMGHLFFCYISYGQGQKKKKKALNYARSDRKTPPWPILVLVCYLQDDKPDLAEVATSPTAPRQQIYTSHYFTNKTH